METFSPWDKLVLRAKTQASVTSLDLVSLSQPCTYLSALSGFPEVTRPWSLPLRCPAWQFPLQACWLAKRTLCSLPHVGHSPIVSLCPWKECGQASRDANTLLEHFSRTRIRTKVMGSVFWDSLSL